MARTGTFKRFNGTEWVDYYFRTTPEMVIGLTTILNNLATLNTDQTITGTKTIVDKDFHMDGGSVNYIRPNTTGGWARGFWWSKRSTDEGGATRIGGIGVLGSNQSVTKFYIGFGASPWSSSAFEVYSSYINVKGLRINNVPLEIPDTSHFVDEDGQANREVMEIGTKPLSGFPHTNIYFGHSTETQNPMVTIMGEEDFVAVDAGSFTHNGKEVATDAYVDAAVDSLNAELNAKVPDTRTINGIKLLQDITLTANDIDPNILRHTYYAPAWNLQEGSRLIYSSSYGWLTQNGPFAGEWEKIRSRVASTNLTSVSSGDTVGSVTCNTPLAHGNTIMIEVNNHNGAAYTTRFVTVTLGPASTSPNTTNDNNIVSFTTWNGTNLVIYSFSVKHSGSTLYFGSKKKIQGEFSGTTITWTTNDYTLQVGKVFRVKE